MFKLQNKFSLLFISISLIPLILTIILGVYFIYLTQFNSIYQLELQLLSQKGKEIENFLDLTQGPLELQILGSSRAISTYDSNFRKLIISETMKINKQFVEISLLDYDTLGSGLVENGKEVTKIIREKKSDTQETALKEINDYKNYKNENGFQDSVNQGKIVWGEIMKGENDSMIVSLFVPVRNPDKVIIGVVRAVVDLAQIKKIIGAGAFGQNGYIFIANKPGQVIFSSNQSFALKEQSSGSFNLVKLTLNGKEITIFDNESDYKNIIGQEIMASSLKIKRLNSVLAVEWPKEDAMEIVYSSIRQSIIFSALTLVIVLILSFLFAQKLVKPIKMLILGSKKIGDGNFDYKINIKTKDEIEELAESFNSMAKNLKEVEELKAAKIRAEALTISLAKEMELSKVKDKFISTASHQLRTPISVIRWLSESLSSMEEKSQIKQVKQIIQDLYQNSAQLALIMGDMLTVSELGLNYQPKDLKLIDLNNLIDVELAKYVKEIGNKNLKVNYEKKIKPSNLYVNELAIRKVLDNLIDNAITYSNDGALITLELKETDSSASFYITDEGIGISEDEKSMVFEEFFRAKNSVEKKNVGTGLGLFIVKTVILGHNGQVGFSSIKNKGSTFWFRLNKKTV